MPSTAKKLSMAMEAVKEDDLDGHKLIWSFSSEHMKADGVPPLSALVYGARRILLPEMHWESTPDLLDILAIAELIRKQTLQDASEALEWDQYYRNAGKDSADGVPLTDRETKKLQSIVKKAGDEIMRSIYRTVIMQLCWAHIHLLRRSRETYMIMHYFGRYFPRSTTLKTSKQHPLWLGDLSELETAEYDNIRQKLKDFLQNVEDWEQIFFKDLPATDEAHKDARLSPEYQSEFCAKFSLLVEWNKLVDIVLRHLKKIQNLASALHSMFLGGESTSDANVVAQGNDVSPILRTSRNRTDILSSPAPNPEVRKFQTTNERDQGGEKKESQDSNVSSKLSYVDAPANVGHAPPTSLIQKGHGKR